MAYPQKAFASTTIHSDCLVGRRRRAAAANTLPYQLRVLKSTGRYEAFKLQWHPSYHDLPLVWPIPNHLFWDSDVAKWIEGACYILKEQSLPDVHDAVAELVAMICSAQAPDGYINIHYTVVEPGKRFTNLRDMHELYNAGHLIEAALAHHDTYRNDDLLGPISKYVALLCETFGPGSNQLHGYPGHPGIELALLRLYECTRDPRHLALARYFLTERGNPTGVQGNNYFVWEAEKRGDDPVKRPAFYPEPQCLWYHQAHAPIAEQLSIEGHSVRAMYLLTAAADLHRVEKDSPGLGSALENLWENMIQRKMYVTGGIGAIKQWEGFGQDFYLPQGTDEGGCYSETCASIGVMMLAQRMLQINLDAKFGDVLELCLYNAVLTAMSHDGKAFTYINQLASSNTDLSHRKSWFTVACCPPNILRLLGSIGGYIWTQEVDEATRKATIIANLYIPNTLEFSCSGEAVRVSQETNWPWSGDITFSVEGKATAVGMKLRIPRWATSFELQPPCPHATTEKGYLDLPSDWVRENPRFTFSIPLTPRWIAPHPCTGQNILALARGPVVYCVEDTDNPWVDDHFRSVAVDSEKRLIQKSATDEVTGDTFVSITLQDGARRLDFKRVDASPSVDVEGLRAAWAKAELVPELHFIPYYFRANRGGKGHMRVGLMRWTA